MTEIRLAAPFFTFAATYLAVRGFTAGTERRLRALSPGGISGPPGVNRERGSRPAKSIGSAGLQEPGAGNAGVVAHLMAPVRDLLPKLFHRNRQRRFTDEELLEFIRSTSSGLRAGLSLYQAVAASSSRIPVWHPLRHHLDSMLASHELGVPLVEAFRQMAERAGSPDLHLVASSLHMVSEYGGDTPRLLDEAARTISRRRTFQEMLRAKAADARWSARVLVIMPAAMGATTYAFQGELLARALSDPLGRSLLGLAVLLWLAGSIAVWRLARQADAC